MRKYIHFRAECCQKYALGWDGVKSEQKIHFLEFCPIELFFFWDKKWISIIFLQPSFMFSIKKKKLLGFKYSWLDKNTSYCTHYRAGIKIWYQKNVELIYHKRLRHCSFTEQNTL